MTNTAMEHLRYFAQTLGPRPLGGEANRRAAEYAEKVMKAAGLTVERQTFPCMQWTQGTARLTVSGQEISARPAPYAKPVDAAGPAACVDTREALDMADLRGRVAVLRGAWTRQPLSPKDNPFWYPDEDREVVERLEGSGALALLLSCEGEAMIDDGRFTVPCALIAEADANAMKDGMTVHLHMDCARGQTRAFNVVGLLGSAEKRVCVSAHSGGFFHMRRGDVYRRAERLSILR